MPQQRRRDDPLPSYGSGVLPARSPVSGLRRRRLGQLPVLAQSVAAVAPCGAMATIPAIVMGATGGSALLAFVCAMVIALLISWCIRQFAVRMGAAGGLYTYTAKGLRPGAALVTGWSALLGYAAVGMAGLFAVGWYLADAAVLIGLPPALRTPTSVAVIVLAAGLAWLLMHRGIRLSARTTLIVECTSIVLVLIVLGVLLFAVLPNADVAAAFSWKPDLQPLALGIVLAMSAFIGFESGTTLGVEAHRPLESVPRALLLTAPCAGLLYLISTAVQSLTLSASASTSGAGATLAEMVAANEVAPVSLMLDLAIAASFFACMLASTNALVRVMFCMGREGILPRRLGRTDPRFQTPTTAFAAAIPVVTAVPVVYFLAGGADGGLADLLTLSAFGYLTSYLLICIATPLFLRRLDETTPLAWIVAGVASTCLVLIAVYAIALSVQRHAALVIVFGGVVLGAVVAAVWLRVRAPDTLAGIGIYDQTSAQDVSQGARRGLFT